MTEDKTKDLAKNLEVAASDALKVVEQLKVMSGSIEMLGISLRGYMIKMRELIKEQKEEK